MRIAMTAAAICILSVGLSIADDVRASIQQVTNIPAQPLASALRSLAKDRKFQIVYVSEEIGDRLTAGAVGEYTPEEALKQLLKGTGLTYQYLDGNTITVMLPTLGAASGAPSQNRFWRHSNELPHEFRAQHASQQSPAVAEPPSHNDDGGKMAAPEPPLSEIVVTGTRVNRSGYDAPTPVSIMNVEEINRNAPVNIADFVNQIPAFANSATPQATHGQISDAQSGSNNLNLRALGANRTLVLLDGVRVVSSAVSGDRGSGGSVDVNAIPDALVQRIDVVTGGASAGYGSDALSGVVNFILDKNFTGIKGSITGGVTKYSDNAQYGISLTAGTGFAGGRGHLLLSGSENHKDGILTQGNRPWVNEGRAVLQNPSYTPTNGQPFMITASHVGSAVFAPGGLIAFGPLVGTTFGPGGVPQQFNYGSIVSPDGSMVGGDWKDTQAAVFSRVWTPHETLEPRITRQNLFGRLSYDITDDLQVYAQAMNAVTQTLSYGLVNVNFSPLDIQSGNPFIPTAVQQRMTVLGVTSVPLFTSALGPAQAANRRELQHYTAGFTDRFNAFGSQWSLDAYIEHSASLLSAKAQNDTIPANLTRAVDVVVNPVTGLPTCRSTLSNAQDGCIPFNPMGTAVNSQNAIDYVTGTAHLQQTIKQDVFAPTLRGEPFSIWAGPVSLAVGGEHRRESVSGSSDPISQAKGFFVGNYLPTFGQYHVTEGFLETVVPLAKEMRWAKALELNGAVRETHYSTSGSVTTWKIGATYSPIPDVRFRFTRSRDIRAPNLGELFLSGSASVAPGRDTVQGGQAVLFKQITSGNPDLVPEKADTTGVGVVFRPTWVPGFSASFDYYKISIGNSISVLASQAIIDLCAAGNQAYCGLIQRDAGGNLTAVNQIPTNSAFSGTKGFDVEASYTSNLSDIVKGWSGALSARLMATHVLDLTTVTADGVAINGAGNMDGTVYTVPIAPHWRYWIDLAYRNDNFTLSWTGRGVSGGVRSNEYIECTTGCPASTPQHNTIDNNHLPGAFLMDVSMAYRFGSASRFEPELFLVVENVANWEPNVTTVNFGVAYDPNGRTFRAGFRFKM